MATPTPPILEGDYPPAVKIAWCEGWRTGYHKGRADERADKVARLTKSGSTGGVNRAAALTPNRRREIARKAAAKRWGRPRKEKP